MTSSKPTPAAASTASVERPVYLLSKEIDETEDLALDLRRQGLRVRTFVNTHVLRNAVRGERPLAVVADIDFAGTDLRAALAQGEQPPALLFIGKSGDFDQRLQAVRAGGAGYYARPVNRSALLHQLVTLGGCEERAATQILLIDGPHGALSAARRALDEAGFRTLYLTDPRRTMQALERGDFRLLLLCDVLEGTHGTELLQVVRQSLRFHAVPALLLSKSDKRSLDRQAAAAGADALLGLPIAAADLIGVVRRKLERSRQLHGMIGYSIRHDPDSGLLNRHDFMRALRQSVVDAMSGQGRAALIWLQLEPDGPSVLPAEAGQLFARAAGTLRRCLPPLALAARMEAGAAAVLLPESDAGELEALLETLTAQLSKHGGGRCLLGATQLSGRQRSAAEALEFVRQGAVPRPEPAATTAALRVPATGASPAQIKAALQAHRFRLVYQPIANLSGQATPFYEAFVRMVGDDGSDILPQQFIRVAEAAGLGEALDRQVLTCAVHVLKTQQQRQDRPRLFIKLLPDSIGAGDRLLHWLSDALRTAGVEPDGLVLQIRQPCAATRQAETRRFVDAARQLGCGLALEQYMAAGESGLRLLQTLEPDFVRLAARITQDIGSNNEHRKLVEMIAGQCRAIGAGSIASKVQDARNLSLLWRCGVEYIQGYFMQEPADVFDTDPAPRTKPQKA